MKKEVIMAAIAPFERTRVERELPSIEMVTHLYNYETAQAVHAIGQVFFEGTIANVIVTQDNVYDGFPPCYSAESISKIKAQNQPPHDSRHYNQWSSLRYDSSSLSDREKPLVLDKLKRKISSTKAICLNMTLPSESADSEQNTIRLDLVSFVAYGCKMIFPNMNPTNSIVNAFRNMSKIVLHNPFQISSSDADENPSVINVGADLHSTR